MQSHHSESVVILGGGLAALSLSLQLKKKQPDLKILILEKHSYPPPQAAFKVGESTVEIAAMYFRDILGLDEQIADELPKFGLRFFMGDGSNLAIEERTELGLSDFLPVRSFQLDRGRWEKALTDEAKKRGIEFLDQARVTDVELGHFDHLVSYDHQGIGKQVRASWVVDATSRPGFLKTKLGLKKKADHNINSVWFRLPLEIDVDQWANDPQWKGRVAQRRYLSTVHLLGEGYWVWLIPLSSGSTSIGIVADERIHPLTGMNKFDRAMAWLEKYEPQCHQKILPHIDKLQDFLLLKHFTHKCKQVYSAHGWCITGEAGFFLDPFYSPGSDFIAISNSFVTDLIIGSREAVEEKAMQYDHRLKVLFQSVYPNYKDQYPIMGNRRVMPLKITWDFFSYWSFLSLLFYRDALTDETKMEEAKMALQGWFLLNSQMQDFFREWDQLDEPSLGGHDFIDYRSLPYLEAANHALIHPPDLSLGEELAQNLAKAERIASEMRFVGALVHPGLGDWPKPEGQWMTQYLFEMLWPKEFSRL